MELIQKTQDSAYVLIDGKMVAHMTTTHFLSDHEKEKVLKIVEMLLKDVEHER